VLTYFPKLVAALPLAVVHAIGGVLGRVVYWLSPTYRHRLDENLRTAGFPDRLIADTAREAGKQALESLWIWARPRADIVRHATIEGEAVLEAALADGRPIVMLTPHLGCFEVIAQHYAAARPEAHTRPMTVLYRTPRKKILRPLVAGRAADGLYLAPADLRGVRMIIKAMRQREVVGILPDQVPSRGDGVWAPFFGRPAYTMTLPARLACQFNALVLLVYGERLSRGGYRIHFSRMSGQFSGEAAKDAALLNRNLEQLIRRCPMQYLWGYNRYKVPAGAEPPVEQ
jgi:Kdo2-lipid IVA lauroyltransferase/acyltransferase